MLSNVDFLNNVGVSVDLSSYPSRAEAFVGNQIPVYDGFGNLVNSGLREVSDSLSYNKGVVGSESFGEGSSAGTYGFAGGFDTVAAAYGVVLGAQANELAVTRGDGALHMGYRAGRYSRAAGAVSVGHQANSLATTGIVTSMGYNAGQRITTGTEITNFGYSAGFFTTTQPGGTNIGYAAGLYNTGPSNTFTGRRSGQGSPGTSNGSTNACYGAYSGYLLRGGSGNVLLGYQAGYNLVAEDDELHISNSVTDNPLIHGRFDLNNVGLCGYNDYQDGSGVFAIPTVTTAPTSNPTGGAILWFDGTDLKLMAPTGAVQTFTAV